MWAKRETMKRVMTYLPGYKKIRAAADITDSERDVYDFRCLDESCGAEFHLRRRSWPLETTKEVSATFARNPSSKHKPGCDYDYENKVSRHSSVSFFKNDAYHVRINFPLGSSYSDLYPERGRLTVAQKAAAQGNADKMAVRSTAAFVSLLEKEFGSIENAALENLVLHYQGRSYGWPGTFVASDEYTRIFNAAADNKSDVTQGIFCVVRPELEISSSKKGKRRFACTELPVLANGQNAKLRPVIVCETNLLAQGIKTNKTMLLAARPFVSPNVLKDDDLLRGYGPIPVYLYVADQTQMTVIEDKYWNPVPGMQEELYGAPRP